MNKKIFVLGAAILGLSFASCKKDYTCTCSWTFNGTADSDAESYTNVTRGDAHDRCDAAETKLRDASSLTGLKDIECEVGD